MSNLTTLLHPVTGKERVWVSTEASGAMIPARRRDGATETAADAKALEMHWIRPSVRDRWMGTSLRNYTPERVEQICRGAMAGDLTAQFEMFDLMEQTWYRLTKNLGQIKDAVVDLDWNLQPVCERGSKPSPEAQKKADFVESLIWKMRPRVQADEKDFEGTIRELLDAHGKGFSVLEILWETGATKFGNAIKPRATKWVHPRNYGYPSTTGAPDELMLNLREILADGGKAEGGTAMPETLRAASGQEGQWAEFPPDKFLIGIAKVKSGHPLSGAMLRVLGFWWAASNFTAEWFMNFAQVFGMPIRWANYDPSMPQADRDLLEEMLANMGSMSYAMFPAGVTLELKEAAKGAGDNPQLALLNFADKVCDILLLRQTLTTDVGDSGSRALGEVHNSVLGEVKLGAANWVAGVLNQQLIAPLVRMNFGNDDDCPMLVPSLPVAVDPKAKAETHQILQGMGMRFKADWFYEQHDVPMPGPDDDVIEAPAAQAVDPQKALAGQATKGTKTVKAKAAGGHGHDDVTDQLLESVSGVEARWLGGLRPYFRELVVMAQEAQSEEEFGAKLELAIVQSKQRYPELFERIDVEFLADRMEGVMGAACVNGAVAGAMRRRRLEGGAK